MNEVPGSYVYRPEDRADPPRLLTSPFGIAGWLDALARFIFWSWNLLFLGVTLLVFAPFVLPSLLDMVRSGLLPAHILGSGVAVVLVPVVAVVLGRTVLRKHPRRLLALGFGLEVPLMVLAVLRLAVSRDLTGPTGLMGAVGIVGAATCVWVLADDRIEERSSRWQVLRLVGSALLLLVGVYLAGWIALFVVGFVPDWWQVVGPARQWGTLPGSSPRDAMMNLAAFALFAYSGAILIAAPLAMMCIYGWMLRRAVAAVARPYDNRLAWSAVVAVAGATLVLGALLLRQPQRRAFALLDHEPATAAEARALQRQSSAIRAGLVNAYLGRWRYVTTPARAFAFLDLLVGRPFGDTYSHKNTVQRAVGASGIVRDVYRLMVQPLLYDPVGGLVGVEGGGTSSQSPDAVFRRDAQAARDKYAAFFDRSITDAEAAAVRRALAAGGSLTSAAPAWLIHGDRNVHLLRQEVSVVEHGDWADVEIYEVYRNTTPERQEVIYEFSLPESAVITGLWLGNNVNRESRYTHRVAPRGAAEQVYRNEMVRRIDPALVEQVGPRQYRLRIFPIEPAQGRWTSGSDRMTFSPPPPLHMWLTYQSMAGPGGWPLPQLAESRNVYWDRATDRRIAGRRLAGSSATWLPATVPFQTRPVAAMHRCDFATEAISVIALPADTAVDDLARSWRVAAVVDRSASMAPHARAVRQAVRQIAERVGPSGQVDVVLTAPTFSGDTPRVLSVAAFEEERDMYIGSVDPAQMLTQLAGARSRQTDAYDAVLILTDAWEDGTTTGDEADWPVDVPVWMVHLGATLPTDYSDAALEHLVGGGGGAATSVAEALARAAVAADPVSAAVRAGLDVQGVTGVTADIMDEYLWVTADTADLGGRVAAAPATALEPGWEPAAAHWLARATTRRGQTIAATTLRDIVHEFAIRSDIVTPYSSMIVLVNAQQVEDLASLSARGDSFEREGVGDLADVMADPLGVAGWSTSSGHDSAERSTYEGPFGGTSAAYARSRSLRVFVAAVTLPLLILLVGWPFWYRLARRFRRASAAVG